MDIQSEQAYAKLQNISGEEIFVRNIPVRLGKESEKTRLQIGNFIESITISKCKEVSFNTSILYFNLQSEKFEIIAFDPIYVNDQLTKVYPDVKEFYQILSSSQHLSIFNQFRQYSYPLEEFSKLYFPCKVCDNPHIHYFILPNKDQQLQKGSFYKISQLFAPSQNMQNPLNKLHDKNLYYNWSQDDREQLKKTILQYGYGRFKQIQKQSHCIGGKLAERSKQEVRAFSNSFIRTMAILISEPNLDLKYFLYSIVEEQPGDKYIKPDPKDWDLFGQNQRAIAYTKRLQLLQSLKSLIKQFKADQMKHLSDKNHIIWEQLLNFLPNSQLYGQRPSNWWSKKHDTDLLLGTYKFGYANYQMIKTCPEFCFQEFEMTTQYSSFPNSDNLTRRMKKLIATIQKFEEDKGQINFNTIPESDEEDKGWSNIEKRSLFDFLINNGVQLNQDGRSNWTEMKENLKKLPIFGENMEKSAQQIEKMVQKIRIDCQRIIIENESAEKIKNEEEEDSEDFGDEEESKLQQLQQENNNNDNKIKIEQENADKNNIIQQKQDSKKEEEKQNNNYKDEDFIITYQQAQTFNKNTNMIHFVRKNILANSGAPFIQIQEDIVKENGQISNDQSHFIGKTDFQAGAHDFELLKVFGDQGFQLFKDINLLNQNETFQNMQVNSEFISARIEWLCSIFNSLKENQQNSLKKRKNDKVYKDELKKKPKFEIQRDEQGEIVYPLVINGSLTLLNIGEVCILPTYHSEHNLFPIGFKTIRQHASIFNKGARAGYICEILEGADGRPLYKVIPEEDPGNPIVRDSSTGCWVHICQKVNELQDHKKDKVTISGTERFGLLEQNVIRLLENLENSEQCIRYKFKYRTNAKKEFEDEF